MEEKIKISCIQLEAQDILKKKPVINPIVLINTDKMNKKIILQEGEY